jgi:CO/xanthine dehydrogenase Mo-binding subunit
VTKSGILKVHQLDAAFDCGRIVNRDAVLNLAQGGVIFGLSLTASARRLSSSCASVRARDAALYHRDQCRRGYGQNARRVAMVSET